MYIKTPEQFSYSLNIQYLKRSPKELLHQVDGDHVIKLLKVGDEKVLLRIREGNQKLIVEFLNGDPSANAKNFIRQYVHEWFDLEADLTPFLAMASKDKFLSALVTKFYGYRIMGQPDL